MSLAQAGDVEEAAEPVAVAPQGRGVGEVRTGGWFVRLTIVAVCILWLIPTVGVLITSFRNEDLVNASGWWTAFAHPFQAGAWTVENYRSALDAGGLGNSFLNSLAVTIPSTVIPITIAAFAAYAFAWMDFKGRYILFVIVVGLLVVPLQMALIPIFKLYSHLGLYGNVLGLILFHTAFGLPFAIFLLRNFFIGIPKELLEAARIDGASEIRIFLRLILPLGLPAIASLAIFQFLWTWNDLLVALTMARNTQPLTVAIFSNMREFGSNIELIAPAAFFSLAIPLAVFLAFQRYFVQGLLAGSVK
jgi:alpha-glucoside transport system permease protein